MRQRWFALLAFLVLASALASSDDRRCSICRTVLSDRDAYYQVKGGKEIFCERCFKEAPRCSLCTLPTAPGDIDAATGACPKCLAKLPRCKACGKPIVGTFYRYPSSKGVFCTECKNTRPACDICAAPIGESYWKYPDGRTICGDCGDRAVFDVGAIKTIVRNVQETVEKRLGLKLKRPYAVRVEKLSGLAPAHHDQHERVNPADAGLYGKELGLYRLENGKSEIVLLFGLPPDLLYEAAAHEYAHAWQAENGFSDLEPELLEGFAQWVAAEVLRAKGFQGALEKLEARRDFPYGTGYLRLKSINQQFIKK